MATYQTTTTARAADLAVSLQEAKTHLRVNGEDLDEAILLQVEAATAYCESVTGRSLRSSHTVKQLYGDWPTGLVRFDREPVLAISSVKYYDAANSLTTVSSSDYRLVSSDGQASFLEFDYDYTFPTLYDREDAVEIIYTAGYSTVPAAARLAVLLQLSCTFGDLTPAAVSATERSRDALLHSIDWGCYR